MTNSRGPGPAYLSDEIRYWDEIYRQGGGSSAEHYRHDAFGANVWGLYRYGRYFRGLGKDARIVEIGAGAVSKALYLAKFAGFRCTYVTDVSMAGLVANREVARQLGVADRGGYVVTDAEDLALRDGSCDVVFCHSSLHHVSDPGRAITSMARCLRPDGLMIVGHEPNLRSYGRLRRLADLLRLTERHTAEVFSAADAEVHGFRKDDLLAWMREAGMEVVAVDPQHARERHPS